MKRRDFLKLGSLMSAFTFASVGPMKSIVNLPIETAANGIMYRGTHNGQVFTSKDGGKTWQMQSQFGPDYTVLDIFTARDGQLYLQMGYKHYNFHLVQTANKQAWVSQPFKTTPLPAA